MLIHDNNLGGKWTTSEPVGPVTLGAGPPAAVGREASSGRPGSPRTCKGTLFRVTEGIGIKVFDFGLKKEISLGPGQKYFARKR